MGISSATFCKWRPLGVENPAQADRGRSEPGQGDVAAGCRKTTLKPSQRRALVPERMRLFNRSQHNTLPVVRMSVSSRLCKLVKTDGLAWTTRIEEVAAPRR